MLRRATFAVLCGATVACAGGSPPPSEQREPSDARVRTLADTYLAAYFERNPEQITQYGVPGHRHDKLSDNSLQAQAAWEQKEDAWLSDLKHIDPISITSNSLRATYAIVRQTIEGSVAKRVCRDELWTVSQMTGWHVNDGYLVTIQPVGTDEARRDASAVGIAARIHRHRDHESARRRQARIHGPQTERPDRDRPGPEPDLYTRC